MSIEKKCGCKGIRSCLFCEKQTDISTNANKTEKDLCVYSYCYHCNLCWPIDKTAASTCESPLYLGKIKLVPDFCTKEEESTIISFIDRIPWMPSQSGRRKQDFGPKVNFKKKKVKIGEFQGFPNFTEKVIEKLKKFPELSDFDPVELCHLEYVPERGSSIDPHVDDFWLWGERLVTINLNSPTVLTLEPCSEVTCECFQEAKYEEIHNNETTSCKHLLQKGSIIKNSLKCRSENYIKAASQLSNINCELLKADLQNSELLNAATNNSFPSTTIGIKTEQVYDSGTYTDCDSNDITRSFKNFKVSNSEINENKVLKTNHHDYRITNKEKNLSEIETQSDSKINSICNLFRTCSSNSKICIRILLPPRSLFILAGCARYNWFHEIKRQDVVSRRLAMTFRELSSEFLAEGKEKQCGKDLLLLAKKFYDL